jgi:hypothetical protein
VQSVQGNINPRERQIDKSESVKLAVHVHRHVHQFAHFSHFSTLSIAENTITYLFSASADVPIPTAPTIHLSDGWTLNKNTRGQKVADSAESTVPFFFSAARVTTEPPILAFN